MSEPLPDADQVTPEAPAEAPAQPETDWKAEAERLAAEAEKWKGYSRTHEDRSKANAEAARKLKEIEDREVPELERYKRDLAELQERAEKAERTALRAQVASDKGIPANLVAQLTGGTLEELTAAADALLAWRGTVAPVATSQPKPDTSQGAQPVSESAANDALYQQYKQHILPSIHRS